MTRFKALNYVPMSDQSDPTNELEVLPSLPPSTAHPEIPDSNNLTGGKCIHCNNLILEPPQRLAGTPQKPDIAFAGLQEMDQGMQNDSELKHRVNIILVSGQRV